ncbi:S8 family serine peptidase [Ketobacter sp.]|uniref:S8 family serine peptidase n=1 Tax=Ketobacter sp. TaxID=2083498 RepID=UPI0025BEF251|nr:S8 family serine peptidase [Ketobacter sp.]
MISLLLTTPCSAVVESADYPNDPRFYSQWGFEQPNDADVDVLTAWEMVKDKPQSEVIVAVIDTGVDSTHPDLVNRVAPGYDFVYDDSNPVDMLFPHGTPIAGIIAAEKDNDYSVVGLTGDMPVKIMSLRVYSTLELLGLMPVSAASRAQRLESAFSYAIDNGANVINFSSAVALSAVESDPHLKATVESLLKKAQDKGIIIVAGAGNSGSLNPDYFPYQWDRPNIINVASINRRGALAADWDQSGPEPRDHSSYGAHAHLAAPGTELESTWPSNDLLDITLFSPDSDNGTSFAAPYVTAAIAMGLSVRPDLMQSDSPAAALNNILTLRKALHLGVQTTPELQSTVNGGEPIVVAGGFLKLPLFLENLGIRLSERNGESITTYPKSVVRAQEKGGAFNPYGGVIRLEYENRTLVADGTQSHDDHGILRYEWDFGDGHSAQGAVVEHTYDRTGTYYVTLKVMDGEIDPVTGEGKSDVSAPQRVEVLPPEYDFVKIRYKANGEGFAQEGRMLSGRIDIRKIGSLRRIRGTSQFLDENNQLVKVSVTTSFPVLGLVAGNIAFSHPNFNRSVNFATINPVSYDASTNTYSLKVEEMELHFTEKTRR